MSCESNKTFMMKKCAFTICAKNYIGLALSLKKSVEANSTDVDFYIFVADEIEGTIELPDSCIKEAKGICGLDDKLWYEMAFMFDLVEFCTAIKPYCFKYLMDSGYDKLIYFDPDIFIFDSIDFIYEKLDQYKCILTPHVINPHQLPEEVRQERDPWGLMSGINNLGFAAFRKCETTEQVIDWWGTKLQRYAVSEVSEGLFTDQKWTDYMMAMYDSGEIWISKHLGMNFAPWNYHERDVCLENGKYIVKRRYCEKEWKDSLVFFHCSGYDYTSLMEGCPKTDRVTNVYRENILDLLKACGNRLNNSDFRKYLFLNYSYNSFNDGMVINSFIRRQFRRLRMEDYELGNPFDINSPFYRLMKTNKLLNKQSISAIKMRPGTMDGFENKIKWVDYLFVCIKKILPSAKYILLCRLLNKYCRFENQVRLLDKKYRRLTFK